MDHKVDILAIGAHPDDIELSCSGTLMKHIELGYSVGLVDLTLGELGTRGTPETRLREAEDARKIIGAAFRDNLELPDGFFQHNKDALLKVAASIRKYRPKIVLANALSDRHPDHGRGARLIADACFYSGLRKIVINDESGQALDAWRPNIILHYIQDRNLKADVVFDISQFMDKKIEAVKAFKTQFYQGEDAEDGEPSTPISGKDFLSFLMAKNKSYGRDIGAEYAEAFNVQRDFGVKSLFDLI